jgi:phosphoserine phosphatase
VTPISSSGSPPNPLEHSFRRPRSIKLALFDLDGTLTRERSAWEYLHRRLGVWEGHAEKYQEAFLRGEIDYSRFCQLDAAVWKGMRADTLEEMLREVPLYEGIEDLVAFLKLQNIKLGIISSGLSLLAEWVKGRYGFDFSVANELGMTDGVLDGTIRIHVHYDQKGKWVKEAKRQFRAKKEEVLAFGDSSGDIVMFQQAGLSFAFNSRSSRLNEVATLSIHSSDLRDLIPPLIPYLSSARGNFQARNGG